MSGDRRENQHGIKVIFKGVQFCMNGASQCLYSYESHDVSRTQFYFIQAGKKEHVFHKNKAERKLRY